MFVGKGAIPSREDRKHKSLRDGNKIVLLKKCWVVFSTRGEQKSERQILQRKAGPRD